MLGLQICLPYLLYAGLKVVSAFGLLKVNANGDKLIVNSNGDFLRVK